LDLIQNEMYARAKEHRDSHIYDAASYAGFVDLAANNQGFVRAMWCGDESCEIKIKEDTAATSRCIPFKQEKISDVCVCCGKPAKKLVYWGKAY
ncbi:MAG: proline--tRNA ligase, partial [Lachnospiraceae bacterium]